MVTNDMIKTMIVFFGFMFGMYLLVYLPIIFIGIIYRLFEKKD